MKRFDEPRRSRSPKHDPFRRVVLQVPNGLVRIRSSTQPPCRITHVPRGGCLDSSQTW